MMKANLLKAFVYVAFLLLVMPVAAFSAPSSGQSVYRVLIDPAHGGADAGVSVSSRVKEKDITLAVALSLKKVLEGGDRRIKVQLTRTSDKTVSVNERIAMVKAAKPDLMISIHVNAGFGQEASGYEISFPGQKYMNGAAAGTPDIVKDMEKTQYINGSIRLAQAIQKNLEGIFPRKGRGIREVPVPILTPLYAPSACVELGFLTNRSDKDKLLEKDGQKEIARSLGRGIRDYFKL
ncbi:MAG TPA: N-acetylmuramoyl-L-alanine amidase [Syntrophales bacterium]|jgi:N-acetylmuramoyl-L-alanine amidase|nr:N-acetylmuramoyl-L-alanine amidase [Syntrophales bacterium]